MIIEENMLRKKANSVISRPETAEETIDVMFRFRANWYWRTHLWWCRKLTDLRCDLEQIVLYQYDGFENVMLRVIILNKDEFLEIYENRPGNHFYLYFKRALMSPGWKSNKLLSSYPHACCPRRDFFIFHLIVWPNYHQLSLTPPDDLTYPTSHVKFLRNVIFVLKHEASHISFSIAAAKQINCILITLLGIKQFINNNVFTCCQNNIITALASYHSKQLNVFPIFSVTAIYNHIWKFRESSRSSKRSQRV